MWNKIDIDRAYERRPNTNFDKSHICLNLTFFKTMCQEIGNSETGRDGAWLSQDSIRETERVGEIKHVSLCETGRGREGERKRGEEKKKGRFCNESLV